jgi:hypothetical protein
LTRQTVSSLALAACTLLLSGCGLSAYEERMKESQDNLKAFEEQDKVLGEPIDFNEKDKAAPGLFFRPPQCIKSKGDKKPFSGINYYQYSRDPSDKNCPFVEILVAAIFHGSTGFGMAAAPTAQAEDLFVKVRERYGIKDQQPLTQLENRPGRAPLSLQYFAIEKENYIAVIYLHEIGGAQIAIIFHLDKAKKAEADKLMKTSIRSLEAGGDLVKTRTNYERRKAQATGAAKP